jgi:hypothetical protein
VGAIEISSMNVERSHNRLSREGQKYLAIYGWAYPLKVLIPLHMEDALGTVGRKLLKGRTTGTTLGVLRVGGRTA